jgi:hypothetical protein
MAVLTWVTIFPLITLVVVASASNLGMLRGPEPIAAQGPGGLLRATPSPAISRRSTMESADNTRKPTPASGRLDPDPPHDESADAGAAASEHPFGPHAAQILATEH